MSNNVLRLDRSIAESEDVGVDSPYGLEQASQPGADKQAAPITSDNVANTSQEEAQSERGELNNADASSLQDPEYTSDDLEGDAVEVNQEQPKEAILPRKKKNILMIGSALGGVSVLAMAIAYLTYPGEQQGWSRVSGPIVEFTDSLFGASDSKKIERVDTAAFKKQIAISNETPNENITPVADSQRTAEQVTDKASKLEQSQARGTAAILNTSASQNSFLNDLVDSSLSEVAVAGAISHEEQLSIVVNGINSERRALLQPPLTDAEITEAVNVASVKLGIPIETAQAAAKKALAVNKTQSKVLAVVANLKDVDNTTKAQVIADQLDENLPALSENEYRNLVQASTNSVGIERDTVEKIVAGKIAEKKFIAQLQPVSMAPANANTKTPDQQLYEATKAALGANEAAQKAASANGVLKPSAETTQVQFSTEKQIAVMNNIATKLDVDRETVKAVQAQINAEVKAKNDGQPLEAQVLAGKIAAAETQADSKGLSAYEAALYVADKTQSVQAIDTVAVNRNMNPIAKAMVTAHHTARSAQMENYVATGEKPRADKAISEIAASVSTAATAAKLSTTDKKHFVQTAIEIEANALKASDTEKSAETARAMAMIDAKAAGLGDLAAIAVGTGVAHIASTKSSGDVTREEKSKAVAEAVAVVKAAGLPPAAEKDVVASVHKFMGAEAAGGDSKVAKPESAAIEEVAYAQADKMQLTPVEREAYVAKAKVTHKAKQAGLNDAQTKVAVARAEARARAQAMGFTEARIADIEQRAGNAAIVSLKLPEIEIQKLTHAVSKMELAGLPEATVSPVGASAPSSDLAVAVNKELRDQLNRLEGRFAVMSEKLTDAIEQNKRIVANNASLNKTIIELQAAVNGNTAELKSQRMSAQAETERRTANAGWLSSRLCEIEAASGLFANEAVCKGEYARRGQSQYGGEQLSGNSAGPSYSLPVTNTNDFAAPASNAFAGERVFAAIPESEVPVSSQEFVANDTCSAKSPNFSYVIIGEDNALITNRAGSTQRVVKGSIVPGLGAVVSFQVKQQPRFVSFENGIVCQQQF